MLDVRGLTVSYGPSLALSDVDLVVPDGSVVGVLGPNGAGKSTLLKTIAGLVKPVAGTITFRGQRIEGRAAHEVAKRGICLVPEERGILPGLTVRDNLRLTMERNDHILERFPVLAERLDQPAGTLSGGEQQMLALARALENDPVLLAVDEPSLGLAPRLVSMIEATLHDLHVSASKTILWVEQYVSHVLAQADIVYVLGRGKVVWAGEPAELRASPVLVRSYLGETSR
jgi:branched-chain amino acid transport system ATP-binding protein